MNKPIVYLPFSLVVVLSIVYISLSIPSYSLMLKFPRLLYLSGILAILGAVFTYTSFKNKYDAENVYKLTGSALLFSFVVVLAIVTIVNKKFTTKNCSTASYEIVGYKGRYTSGMGKLDKEGLIANQWILTIFKNDVMKSFVLNKDISQDNSVTKTMDLQFCKGILGTEYLNLEQIPE